MKTGPSTERPTLVTETASTSTQADRAQSFANLHIPGKPLILFNIWDAGTARAVADAGAAALATGSWSVAAAQGYADGEALPLDFLLRIVDRMTATCDLPLSVDFETGFADSADGLRDNIERLLASGAVGINFEDQIIGSGLRDGNEQADRIALVRETANGLNIPLFINARTDLFLRESDAGRHAGLLDEASERAGLYAKAGASGIFLPGLADADLIKTACDCIDLPVNIMMKPGVPDVPTLAGLGVARISHGPFPYIEAMADLTEKARIALG